MGSIYPPNNVLKPYSPKRPYIPKIKKEEDNVQLLLCSYVKMQWPNVIFRSDFASGMKMSLYQATKHKRLQSGRAFVDWFLFEPRVVNGVQYAGLGLELKKAGTSIVVKKGPRKGHIVADPHIQEQVIMCKELKRRGYYATIVCGIDEAMAAVDWYMGKTTLQNESIF
jgi:hypothetical protein